MVQRASLGCVQLSDRRVAGNDNVRVVAEPLHAAIPNIAMNIIIGARRYQKKCTVPHRGQHEPDDRNAPGKTWRREELTDRQQVHDASKRQSSNEVRSTSVSEVA